MNDITIVRGDTLTLSISEIKMSDGSAYTLKDTDIIILMYGLYADCRAFALATQKN